MEKTNSIWTSGPKPIKPSGIKTIFDEMKKPLGPFDPVEGALGGPNPFEDKPSTATALQIEETPTATTATTKPTSRISASFANLRAKLQAYSDTSKIVYPKICRKLARLILSCMMLYCLGILFPELRDALPGLYQLVDMFLAGADACFGALAELIQFWTGYLH